ncbi:MAG TPA: hypothetical protein VF450_18390 [Noviherbaspirillum sp.]
MLAASTLAAPLPARQGIPPLLKKYNFSAIPPVEVPLGASHGT